MPKPRINPDAIERERSAAIPSDGGGEAALLFAIRAAGLPEPLTQHQFDEGCCGHSMKYHPLLKPFQCNRCEALEWSHPEAARPARRWRFDFAWPAHMLAVEVDGGTYSGGRHTRGAGYERDCEKANEAVLRGWRVLRVTTQQVDSGEALAWIERALEVKA